MKRIGVLLFLAFLGSVICMIVRPSFGVAQHDVTEDIHVDR